MSDTPHNDHGIDSEDSVSTDGGTGLSDGTLTDEIVGDDELDAVADSGSAAPSLDKIEDTYRKYENQIIHQTEIEAKEADTVPAENVLTQSIAEPLDPLYTHQSTAINKLKEGKNVTVATSTSSGKTWIYTLYYALQKQANDSARALFLFPTKALSANQESAINELFETIGLDATAQVYDGDTSSNARPKIREDADVIITNFSGINHYLNNHTKWGSFFGNISLVTIDESHTYTGVHGMHVIWVLRRLRRVLQHYGSEPQYVCSTATIGNPKEHSEALVGVDFDVVDTDGSPRGKRNIVFWQPPIIDTEDIQRRSVEAEIANISTHLAQLDTQTLCFLRSRQNCEIAQNRANSRAQDDATGDMKIAAYHAGLPKRRRKTIEEGLDNDAIDVVYSTNALELGIDIGSVGATAIGGYPGTRQSFWQQVGRAGRGTSDSLSLYLPRERNAIDQYIVKNPGYLLEDDVEDAVVSVDNNVVYAKHILCAASELPIDTDDIGVLGEEQRLRKAISVWQDAGKIRGDLDKGVQYCGPPRPQSNISMYSTTDTEFEVECIADETGYKDTEGNPEIDIEPVQRERAYRDFHEGSIFMHDGEQFSVEELNEDGYYNMIKVKKVDTPYYTITEHDKHIHDIESEDSVEINDDVTIHSGTGTVDITYTQYRKQPLNPKSSSTAPQPITLPPISIRTQMMWVELSDDSVMRVMDNVPTDELQEVPKDDPMMDKITWEFAGGLHGAEHGMIKLSPLELRIDNSDIGGLSTRNHPEVGGPTWFIHDGVEGGVGFSHSIFENFMDIVERTRDRVAGCDCNAPDGCPSCIVSDQCGNQNEPLSTLITEKILTELVLQD